MAAMLAGSVGVLSAERGYVRPPGALRPREFTARCMRCSICVQVCPTKAVRLLDIGLDMKNISTPVIDTRFDGCIAWGEKCQLCAEKCPTGALSPVAEIKTHKIGPGRYLVGDRIEIIQDGIGQWRIYVDGKWHDIFETFRACVESIQDEAWLAGGLCFYGDED